MNKVHFCMVFDDTFPLEQSKGGLTLPFRWSKAKGSHLMPTTERRGVTL